MKSLGQLNRNHMSADKRFDKKYDELRKQRDEIQKQIDDLKYPSFSGYLEQLGKVTLPLIEGAVSFEVLGPFGLTNEYGLHFNAEKKKNQRFPKTVASASFSRHGGGGYGIKTYPRNDIHSMRVVPLTDEMTLEWFVKFAKKGHRK